MKYASLLAAVLFTSFTLSTNKPAYKLFDAKGKETAYDKMLKAAQEADVVLFGELHDNPIIHWLQLELTQDLYKIKKENLVLGAEMFEADDQVAIDEYLQEKISEKTFKDEVKLWPNFKTDYKPLLDFAKSNKLKFIAANIPRRYANMVYLKGLGQLDSLDAQAKKWIAPLPIEYDPELGSYKDIFLAAGGHGGDNLPQSQAIKDATMAYFILKNWSKGKTFIHYNGTYHSNNREGIAWYLKQARPDLKIVTIASTQQDSINVLANESLNLGDFIIVTPGNLTKTH